MNPQSEIPRATDRAEVDPKSPSPKSAAGRPRVLDEFRRSQICAMVAGGCSTRDAAHFVRCSYDTIRREMKRDPAFKEELRRSEIYAQLSPLRAMQKAVATHWQAAAWFLERAYPERFARRSPATLGPRQARELYDEVRSIINSAVPDPLLCIHIEERLRKPFQCFIRATGQNARTSRDLCEIIKFFERQDGLENLVPGFDFLDRVSKSIRGRTPNGRPVPAETHQTKQTDQTQSNKAAATSDLHVLREIAQKLRDAARDAKAHNKSGDSPPQSPPQQSASPTPAPVGKIK